MTDSPAEKTFGRVLFISGIDGWSVALFAGLCTLVSLLFAEWVGVSIGAVITASGVMELRGRKRLLRGDAGGMSALIRAQVIILGTVGLYALRNLLAYDETTLLALITPEMRNALSQAGMSVADLQPLMKPVYLSLYLTVIALTLLFQGGLALYYQTRKAKVAAALAARKPAVPPAARPQA